MERRVVRSWDVRSVARTAFALSLCVWGIAFVGFVALYVLGLVSGGLGGVEGFIASLGFTDFRLTILPFLVVFVLVAVAASAFVGIVGGLMTYLYNAVFPLTGGIEVTVAERRPLREPIADTPRPQRPVPEAVPPQAAPPQPTPPPPPPPPAPVPVEPPPAPEPSEARHWPHDVPGGTSSPAT